jgi:2-polyprenyl-3-methyl-5-hydroxy-6-metoxy-1,4-benzoquinol methylase
MVGHLTKDKFKPEENYDEFYAGHKFEPFPESLALCADEVLPRVAWGLDIAAEIEAKSVLDLCCLDGFSSLTMAHKLGIKATGVDLSEPGIMIANKRAHANNLDAVYEASAIEDIIPNTKYDLVLLFEAIEHFTDVDKVMEVIKENLRKGGTLLVSTPDAEGTFGLKNTEDVCHLQVYSYRSKLDFMAFKDSAGDHYPMIKPLISLPDYLESQGFEVVSNDVYNELIHTRVVLK